MVDTEEKLKEKIALAEKSVESVKDEKLKAKAFEIVLNSLLSEKVTKSSNTQNKPKPSGIKDSLEGFIVLHPSNLADTLGVELAELSNIIDFTENEFRIIVNIPGKSEGDKQRNASLIILTVLYYCKNQRDIKSSDLRDILRDLGIGSLVNMATNLKIDSSYWVLKGEPSSKLFYYRITTPGIQKGLEIIKSMLAQIKSPTGDDNPQ